MDMFILKIKKLNNNFFIILKILNMEFLNIIVNIIYVKNTNYN